MTRDILRQVSIITCLAGIATALVLFVALYRGTPVPVWMPVVIAMAGGYELAQFGHGAWRNRIGR